MFYDHIGGMPRRPYNASERLKIHIGTRIHRRRQCLGLDRSQVAQQLNWHEEDLEACETGAERVSSFDLHRLSQILNVSIAFFYADTPIGLAANATPADDLEDANMLKFRAPDRTNTPTPPAAPGPKREMETKTETEIYRIPHSELQMSALDFTRSPPATVSSRSA